MKVFWELRPSKYSSPCLSTSQADLNSNIQINYPENSETSFTEDTGENYFTDYTGTGNDTGNYREEGEQIVSQALAGENINCFALIYNDGNAHFQGSVTDSSYDLSAIEPYNEEFNADETYDDNEDILDLELPFKFEHEFESGLLQSINSEKIREIH